MVRVYTRVIAAEVVDVHPGNEWTVPSFVRKPIAKPFLTTIGSSVEEARITGGRSLP